MKHRQFLFLIGFIFLAASSSVGQSLLSKSITVNVNRTRLDDVLEVISNKGNFYFSYNSSIVKRDSLVTINISNKSVKEILDALFDQSFEFKESGNYIIIRKAPIRVTMVTNKAVAEEKFYSVSGFVYDERSGTAIHEASIYDKKLLASALTNDNGFFKIRLKSSKASTVELTVSKEFYEDTTVKIESRHNQELTITLMPLELTYTVTITPQDYLLPDSLKPDFNIDISKPILTVKRDSIKVERTGVGRFLFSTKQTVQSLNLKGFFTTRPFQLSFIPGVSTHGKLGAQVVNNFSLNILGGYTAGTNGVEFGGLFNINKKDVKYVQAAGIFNVVGGKLKGVQFAGINNTVLDSVKGVQGAGINNIVRGKFDGFQAAGIYNHVTDSVNGLQAAGIGNFARKKVSGAQIAGIVNFSNQETDGAQVAGIINYSKKLRGLQIGLINIADTSEGYSIGLINIVLKGYHKLSISTNEILQVNAAFKTGNSKLYSILQAGMTQDTDSKIYSFGYGLGTELSLNKRKTLTLNPEVTSQYLYSGSWDYTNVLNKLHLNLNVKLNRYISFFAGPSYAVYISDQTAAVPGYKFPVSSKGLAVNTFSDKVSGWVGWNAGISFF
jgi:hypothetical protein